MAQGNRDFMEDLMFVVRHFHDLPWDNERFAEAMEHMWHKGMERGRAVERGQAAISSASATAEPAPERKEVHTAS